ncbi:MAG: NuoM family protein, partial [bacterium]
FQNILRMETPRSVYHFSSPPIPWFPSVGISWVVGVDGLSMALLVLTGILFVAAALGSWSIKHRVKEYSIFFLVLQTGIIGVFIALDYFVFYIMWELMLVPMYFLIGIWGGPRRIYAAIKFFIYTLAGSIALLVGIILLYLYSGTEVRSFFVPFLTGAGPSLPVPIQQWIFWLFFFGFGVKIPIVPLHTWLPDAHVEAPTPISVILAGLLLKTGGYGFFRFLYPTFPDMARAYAIPVATIGVIMVVYAALVAMAQADVKTLIANASISHMGYVVFGLSTMTPEGITAGIFQMVSHGFISGSLFLLAGVIYDRAHTRIINEFGGLAENMPGYYAFFTLAGMGNLALPGLSGFWGELLSYMGAFKNFDYVFGGVNLFRLLALAALPGIVITAGYTLWAIQRMFLGPLNPTWKDLKDVDFREVLSLAIPGFFIVLLGLFP